MQDQNRKSRRIRSILGYLQEKVPNGTPVEQPDLIDEEQGAQPEPMPADELDPMKKKKAPRLY